MRITIDISAERIAQLFAAAIEGGDPVTTASRGGWCVSIDLVSSEGFAVPDGAWWYTLPAVFGEDVFPAISIVELDDETTGHETTHEVRKANIERGLAVMAAKFPSQFAQILEDNIDAPAADLFLQSVLFGEEKYA